MSVGEFTIEMLKAVAWPATVLVAVLLLRRPIGDLIGLLKSVRYGGLEIGFGQEVQEVVKQAAAVLPSADGGAAASGDRERLLDMAFRSPESAVVESWRRVENAVVDLARAKRLDVAPAVWAMPLVLSAFLLNARHIHEPQHSVILRLKAIRDRLTHTKNASVTADDAIAYVDTSLRLVASMGDTGRDSKT
jgi:hypothetical protein